MPVFGTTVGFYHQAVFWGHCWDVVLRLEKIHHDILLEAGAMHACAFAWS